MARAAVEAIDQGLAAVAVPEAYLLRLVILDLNPQARDGGGVTDGRGGGVAQLVTDLHADGFRHRVGISV